MVSSPEISRTERRLTDLARAAAAADASRSSVPGDEHWGRMLTMAAEVRVAAAHGDGEIISRLRDKRRSLRASIVPTDHCSTWLDLLVVAELQLAGAAEEDDLTDALRVADHVVGVPRTADGLVAVEGPDGTPWAFTDTVHFALVPMAVLAASWDRPDLRDFAVRQIDAHTDALVTADGVAHGVSRLGGESAGVDWGRSTGYLVQGLADAEEIGLELAARTRRRASALWSALAAAQDAAGSWHLRPLAREGGPEDSGSALLLSSLVTAHAVDSTALERGLEALLGSLELDGDGMPTLLRVAEEIPIEGIDDYDAVRRDRFPWGTAALLRLAASLASVRAR